MLDTSHHHLTHFLAPARIARYRSFLNLKTDAQVYRAYSWNYALSAMIFPLLGFIEMHLRDAIHQVMSRRYAPTGTKHHDYAWYDDSQPQHYPFSKQAKMSIDGVLLNKPLRATTPQSHHSLNTLAYTEPHTIHLRDGKVVLFKRQHSVLWECRYKLADGAWHRTSTRCASIEAAVVTATNLYDASRYRQRARKKAVRDKAHRLLWPARCR